MKNKLIPEEELLRSTLNESQFTYQEADWKQIESAVAKKGFWTNYNPFFKAAAAFVVLGAAIYVLNQRYQTTEAAADQVIAEKQTERLDAKTETAKVKDNSAKDGTPTQNEEAAIQEISANSEAVIDQNTTLIQQKESATPNTLNGESNLENINQTAENSEEQVDAENIQVDFEIKEIHLLSAPCAGTKLDVDLNYRGFYTDDMNVTWKLDGKTVTTKDPNTSIAIERAGNYTITASVYKDGNAIASNSNSFVVEEKVTLDFSAENLSNPFNDEKVRLTINQPAKGKYVWYENRANDKLLSGTEVDWSFNTEGHHNISVGYTSDYGCLQKKTKGIDVEFFFKPEVFPNAFTPYNGGYNEVFELNVLKQYDYKSYELVIVNMNGNEVFRTINKDDGWNGQLNNSEETLSGKFSWFVKLQNIEGEQKIFKGKVEIR